MSLFARFRLWSWVILYFARYTYAQSYTVKDAYSPANFFSLFDFYTGEDPTSGFVQYVNQSYAEENGLIATYADYVYIGVDTTHVLDPKGAGRPSVRITGIPAYTHGLYILSLSHMPYGCGTWPAFWSLGPDWPNNGEIDIIEGVNTNTENLMSLHTSENCTTAGVNQTGTLETSNCYIGTENTGCGVQSTSVYSYGAGFNDIGGGVYAMEWTSASIKIWFFKNTAIPPSITAGAPNPTSDFGTPAANFQGSCSIDSHFAAHNIVFDNTFCGSYAGNSYGSTSCPMTSGDSGYQSCVEYVALNPTKFVDAYWQINYLNVYQLTNASAVTATSTSISSSKPVVASTAALTASTLAVGMGVNTSSTSLTTSLSLSLPTTTSSTALGVPSQSTYTGPNTVTANTSSTSISSTSSSVSSMTSSHSSSLPSIPASTSTSTKVTSSPLSAAASKSSTSTSTPAETTSSLSMSLSSSLSSSSTMSSSFTQLPGALPTSSAADGGIPICHSVYVDQTSAAYRIYCNSTIEGAVLKVDTVNDFPSCIQLCDAYITTCTASIWSNTSLPGSCSLVGVTASKFKRAVGVLGIDPFNFVALRLADASASAPPDPTTTIASSASSSSVSTVTTSTVVSSFSVSTLILGTITSTSVCPTCILTSTTPTSATTTSAFLCVTCGLVPTVVTASAPTTAALQTTTSPISSSTTTFPLLAPTPSTCPATKVTKYVTTWVTTSLSTCYSIPSSTCPFPTTPTITPITGSTNPPTCPPPATEPSQTYIDIFGMAYAIHCGAQLNDASLALQSHASFPDCMAACDMWNVQHYYAPNATCRGVTWYTDGVSPNCLLKGSAGALVGMESADAGVLLTGLSGGNASVALPGSSSSVSLGSMAGSGGRTSTLAPLATAATGTGTGGGGVTGTPSTTTSGAFVFPTLTIAATNGTLNATTAAATTNSDNDRFINTVTTTTTTTTTDFSVSTTSVYVTVTVTTSSSKTTTSVCRTQAVHIDILRKRGSVLKGFVAEQKGKAVPGGRAALV